MSELVKCKALTNGYAMKTCSALSNSVDGFSLGRRKNQKGLFSSSVVNMNTCENLGLRFTLHSGDYKEGGIILNTCPFCLGELIGKDKYKELTEETEDDEYLED